MPRWHHTPAGCQGAVIDGRDVGTVLFPEAPLKLYVTASAEVRAQRRWAELQARHVSRGAGAGAGGDTPGPEYQTVLQVR